MKRARWMSGVAAFALMCAGGWALLWQSNSNSSSGVLVQPLPVVHHAHPTKKARGPASVQTLQFGCAAGDASCASKVTSPRAAVTSPGRRETVDVFGGSMTAGWVDPAHDSFVERAVASLSASTGVQYQYHDYAIPGFTAEHYEQKFPGRFAQTLKNDHPQVVILAWGLENDMNNRHTRDSTHAFATALHQEIAKTLAVHAVAIVVTPPVTKQLTIFDHFRVYRYIRAEWNVAHSFHSPDVVWVNLYQQMEQFLAAHHQTYKLYEGNAWHPNRAGHILAGHILSQDLVRHFGRRPMAWQRPIVYG